MSRFGARGKKRHKPRCPSCAGRLNSGRKGYDGNIYRYCPTCGWDEKPKKKEDYLCRKNGETSQPTTLSEQNAPPQ